MTRTLTLAAVALATITLSGCAATRDTVGSLLGRDQGFSGLDKNGDGVLSEAEVQEVADLAESFSLIDTNSDGNVNRNEFRAANVMVTSTDFRQLDINGDGVISKREADASRRSLRETFDEIDADRDGNVSGAEYRAATTNLLQRVDFDDADTDGDGVLDRQEVERHPIVSAHFDAIDVNSDGLIGPDEFEWAQRN